MATEPTPTDRSERFVHAARTQLRKPVVWVIGVVVAAFGVAVTNALVPAFGGLLDRITTTGPPVQVLDARTFRSDEIGRSVAFGSGTAFSDTDLGELNAQADRTSWLESRGGSAVGTVLVQLVLAGHRTDPVRIVDMQPVAACSDPLTGSLFEDPPAGNDESTRIDFDLDSGNGGTYRGDDGRPTAFFPARTISLAEGEQQVLIATASTRQRSCEVRFRLTVLDGSRRAEVMIPETDQPGYLVSAKLDGRAYDSVYLGGVICSGDFVRASEEYLAGSDPDPCR